MNIKPLSRRGFLKTMAPLISVASFFGMIKHPPAAQSAPIQNANPLMDTANELAGLRALDGERINARKYGFLPSATPAAK